MKIVIDHNSDTHPFLQIAAFIKDKIDTGIYPPGTLIPSVREIVKTTGVSLTTAQKAISLLKREKLIYSSPGKGSYVSEQENLFNNRVYVFLPSSALSFFMKILNGLTQQARVLGYEIILYSLDTDKLNWNESTIEALYKAQKERSGVIFIEEAVGEVKKVCMEIARSIPFVTIEWTLDGASSIVNDYSNSVEDAFAKLNKERKVNALLVLKGRDYQYNVIERMKGFRRIAESQHWEIENNIFFRNSDFDAISGYNVTKEFFSNAYVDTIFCANDYEAIGVIGALTEMGILVGKEVQVLGYGDMVDKVTSYFPVTTISQNLEEIGTASINAIQSILKDKKTETIVINTDFIKRKT